MSAQDQIASIESALSASQGAPVTEKPASSEVAKPEPIVAETPKPEVANEEEAGDEAASSEDAGQHRGNKTSAKDRIGELTRDKRQAQRERDEAAREAEHWRQVALGKKPEAAAEPAQTQPQAGDQAKKTLQDFGGDLEQYADYLSDVKAEAAIKRRESAAAEGRQREEAQKVVKAYRDRVEAFNAENPDADYDEMVTNGNLKISGPMADFIIESDIGPTIGVYFHDNPDEAAKIFAMNGTQRDRAMARLETKLSATEPAEQPARVIPPAPAQITRAPPAPRQVQGGKTGNGSSTVEGEIAAVRALKSRS